MREGLTPLALPSLRKLPKRERSAEVAYRQAVHEMLSGLSAIHSTIGAHAGCGITQCSTAPHLAGKRCLEVPQVRSIP